MKLKLPILGLAMAAAIWVHAVAVRPSVFWGSFVAMAILAGYAVAVLVIMESAKLR